MKAVINTADLFCGAGGASTGLSNAIRSLGLRHRGIAVNHWSVAVDTMRANHPDIDTNAACLFAAVDGAFGDDAEAARRTHAVLAIAAENGLSPADVPPSDLTASVARRFWTRTAADAASGRPLRVEAICAATGDPAALDLGWPPVGESRKILIGLILFSCAVEQLAIWHCLVWREKK